MVLLRKALAEVQSGDRVRVDLIGTSAQTFTVVESTPAGPVLIDFTELTGKRH